MGEYQPFRLISCFLAPTSGGRRSVALGIDELTFVRRGGGEAEKKGGTTTIKCREPRLHSYFLDLEIRGLKDYSLLPLFLEKSRQLQNK